MCFGSSSFCPSCGPWGPSGFFSLGALLLFDSPFFSLGSTTSRHLFWTLLSLGSTTSREGRRPFRESFLRNYGPSFLEPHRTLSDLLPDPPPQMSRFFHISIRNQTLFGFARTSSRILSRTTVSWTPSRTSSPTPPGCGRGPARPQAERDRCKTDADGKRQDKQGRAGPLPVD